ncbi:MAG: DNA-processing protein DprA [Eubacterium sp.]|nr:DNA-processing protein DprA [Eubacterium sp.]
MNYKFALHKLLLYSPATTGFILENNISAEEIFTADKETLWLMNIFTPNQLYNIEEIKQQGTETEEEEFEKSGMKYVCAEDEDYPEKLKNIPEPPYGLFYYGSLLPDRFTVGVVGSRNTCAYGSVTAFDIGKDLAKAKVNLISGMARGVDTAGHKGALEAGGYTAAVLGCGADVCYPRENINVYNKIKTKGGIISEYFPKTNALRPHFPLRNRIISGLCDALIVVEAREKSGSLITAAYALEQGKDIYAVPGPIDSKLCAGTNYLISQGAGVFTSTEDFLKELSIECNFEPKNEDDRKNFLAKNEIMVYSVITLLPKSIDDIVRESGLEFKEVLKVISFLTTKGYITEIGKNMYVRLGK